MNGQFHLAFSRQVSDQFLVSKSNTPTSEAPSALRSNSWVLPSIVKILAPVKSAVNCILLLSSNRYQTFLRIHYILAITLAGIVLINIFLFVGSGQILDDYLGRETIEFYFMAQRYDAFLLIITAFILSIVEVSRYKKIVQKEYSDYEMLNINWLWRFVFVILPIIIVRGMNLVWIALGGENDFRLELATWGEFMTMIMPWLPRATRPPLT